ncbi:MAG: hypothetical protein Q8O76_10025 [Chloroflexota bacterium]|nr:hypothetical protein [Chloroflexota bacterium]
MQRFGEWVFILGAVIAIVGGLIFPASGQLAIALVVLGAIVGLLNVTEQKANNYIVAAIGLYLAGVAAVAFGPLNNVPGLPDLGNRVTDLVKWLAIFAAPAAAIVAVKSLYNLSSKK